MFTLQTDETFGGQLGKRFGQPAGDVGAVGVFAARGPERHVHLGYLLTVEDDGDTLAFTFDAHVVPFARLAHGIY